MGDLGANAPRIGQPPQGPGRHPLQAPGAKGHQVDYVVVPCDGSVIIAASANLTEEQGSGPSVQCAPTSGLWLQAGG